MKKALRSAGIFIGILLLLIIFYIGSAFGLSRIAVNKEQASADEVTIYILSNGVHTDIVVPIRTEEIDWSSYFKFENTAGNDASAELLALGWGDRGFYLETPTWADLKFSTAFKAAFGFSTSAIHATFYKSLKEDELCKSIRISKNEYAQLTAFIKESLILDAQGLPLVIQTDANYGRHDAFYEAQGSYSLFHTCNTWTNNALKAGSQRASLWTPHDKGIFYHYQ